MRNPFDFNKNGAMDPREIAVSTYLVGSTLISGDGYGPGVEDAESSKPNRSHEPTEEAYDFDEEGLILPDDYYDHENPEDEYCFDEEGHCDNDDFADDECLDEDKGANESDSSNENFDQADDLDNDEDLDVAIALEDAPGAHDLDPARKLADHLQNSADSAEIGTGDCTECAFWSTDKTHGTRAWCCQIWYWVRVECGENIRDIDPAFDEKICPKLQQGTGVPTTCYDCLHWDRSKLKEKRSEGCNNWSRVLDDIKQLRRKVPEQFASSIEFKVFESGYPYEDDRICFDFFLDRSLEPGYGKAQAAQMKDKATLASLSTKGTYVTGIPVEGRTTLWLSAMESDDMAISLRREPENQYDPNAIAVLLNDKIAGYLPAKIAALLAPIMDEGKTVSVNDCDIKSKASSKNPENKKVSVQIYLNFNALNSDAHALLKTGPRSLSTHTCSSADDVLGAIGAPTDE